METSVGKHSYPEGKHRIQVILTHLWAFSTGQMTRFQMAGRAGGGRRDERAWRPPRGNPGTTPDERRQRVQNRCTEMQEEIRPDGVLEEYDVGA